MTLPTIFTWPLIIPVLPAPGAIPSALVPGRGISDCNPAYMTEAEILAVLDRVFPEWYLSPIKDPGPGYELYQAFAKTLERVSLAIGRFECASFIIYSHGAAFAVGPVEFYRSSASAGAFVVKKGTIVRTSSTGRSYAVLEDVSFGALDLVQPAQVQAVAPGHEYNVPGPIITADGTLLPGDIDTVVIPILDPVYAEPTIQVRQIADATGGQAAVLDQLGIDRNIPRMPLEEDEVYKGRIRQLPDTVSPDALSNQLDAIFLPLGFSYDLIETWENRYNTCWNAPDTGDHPIFGQLTQLAYNDPRDDRFIPRWMSERDHRGAFVVIMPDFPTFADRGMAYNDPATEGSMSRAVSAWNSPVLDGPSLSGVWNGEDDDAQQGRSTFLHYVWDLLRQIKGGGVAIAFFSKEPDQLLP